MSLGIFFHPHWQAHGHWYCERPSNETCLANFLTGILDCPFFSRRTINTLTRGERAAWKTADYACSPCSLSTDFTRTLRRCLVLQICITFSHSRYAATYFIANHPSLRHPSHLLLIISTTCLRCPQIIFPSHTGYRLNRSIVHPWTCSHLLADKIWTFEFQAGTLAFLEPTELYTWICSNLGDNLVRLSSCATSHVHSDFFFSQHDKDN